ncbi:MAG: DUF72 domain-containing protein [Thermoproteota archaeon]
MKLVVGCCGWAEKGGMSAYFRSFKLVELQSTFYKLPRTETAQRWRNASPQDFEYTLKAWQAITHPITSPTWRRAGVKTPMSKEDRYGYFRQSEENFQAWERTKAVCKALNANICVFQSPPSFRPTEENCENISAFMHSIDRGGLQIAWEPRGEWRKYEEKVRKLCKKLDLIHVVDPFRWIPLSETGVIYMRLHGIGKGETNYSYRYTKEDLRSLLRIVKDLGRPNERIYVLFNNLSMAKDAKRFIELAKCMQLI